jgi:hypothetical protein
VTAPKARPILFSAPMVLAILEGRKMQTRRVVKPVRRYPGNRVCRPDLAADQHVVWWHGEYVSVGCLQECPYGKPGDRLWVREAWGLFNGFGFCDTTCAGLGGLPEDWQLAYRADHIDPLHGDGPHQPVWRPSIHMPRWASRITLEIAAVRVERLQDISEDDARAEGITDGGCLNCGNPEPCECASPEPSARDAFCYLWHQIHGCNSWHTNPWVWVVEFHRSSQPAGEV